MCPDQGSSRNLSVYRLVLQQGPYQQGPPCSSYSPDLWEHRDQEWGGAHGTWNFPAVLDWNSWRSGELKEENVPISPFWEGGFRTGLSRPSLGWILGGGGVPSERPGERCLPCIPAKNIPRQGCCHRAAGRTEWCFCFKPRSSSAVGVECGVGEAG